MTAEIIDFTTTRHRTPAAPPIGLEDLIVDAPRETAGTPPTTATAKNARLRSARWEIWRMANALTNYWDALLDFRDAVELAKRCGLKEARAHAEISAEERWSIVDSYRDALGKQLLTPAPDVASVNWKRHRLSKCIINVKKELVEKAIADDIAFLDAHPARNSRANKLG
jgi:hypothetical protein